MMKSGILETQQKNVTQTHTRRMQNKKIAVFLDEANCFYTQKKMGWSIDAEKLLNYCKEYGEVVEATYYTGASTEGS